MTETNPKGAAGLRAGGDNMPTVDPAWWASYRNRLESAAKDASED